MIAEYLVQTAHERELRNKQAIKKILDFLEKTKLKPVSLNELNSFHPSNVNPLL